MLSLLLFKGLETLTIGGQDNATYSDLRGFVLISHRA